MGFDFRRMLVERSKEARKRAAEAARAAAEAAAPAAAAPAAAAPAAAAPAAAAVPREEIEAVVDEKLAKMPPAAPPATYTQEDVDKAVAAALEKQKAEFTATFEANFEANLKKRAYALMTPEQIEEKVNQKVTEALKTMVPEHSALQPRTGSNRTTNGKATKTATEHCSILVTVLMLVHSLQPRWSNLTKNVVCYKGKFKVSEGAKQWIDEALKNTLSTSFYLQQLSISNESIPADIDKRNPACRWMTEDHRAKNIVMLLVYYNYIAEKKIQNSKRKEHLSRPHEQEEAALVDCQTGVIIPLKDVLNDFPEPPDDERKEVWKNIKTRLQTDNSFARLLCHFFACVAFGNSGKVLNGQASILTVLEKCKKEFNNWKWPSSCNAQEPQEPVIWKPDSEILPRWDDCLVQHPVTLARDPSFHEKHIMSRDELKNMFRLMAKYDLTVTSPDTLNQVRKVSEKVQQSDSIPSDDQDRFSGLLAKFTVQLGNETLVTFWNEKFSNFSKRPKDQDQDDKPMYDGSQSLEQHDDAEEDGNGEDENNNAFDSDGDSGEVMKDHEST